MKKIKALTLVSVFLIISSCSKHEVVKDNENEIPAVVEVEKAQENQSNIVVDDSSRFHESF